MNVAADFEAMRSRNRVDAAFPALRHGELCALCKSRRVDGNGRHCDRCLEVTHGDNEGGSDVLPD